MRLAGCVTGPQAACTTSYHATRRGSAPAATTALHGLALPSRRSFLGAVLRTPVSLARSPSVVTAQGRVPTVIASASSQQQGRQSQKELNLESFRTVYDFDKWETHRCTTRYIRHMAGLLTSRIMFGLLGPLVAIALLTTSIGAYETLRAAGSIIPSSWPSLGLQGLATAFNMSSFALSLLLVFRTNTSYSRFDEARKLWGGVVNRTRDTARMATAWLVTPEDRPRLEALTRWLRAYPWIMKNHLRKSRDWQNDLKDILLPEEVAAVIASPHGPMAAVQVMSKILAGARIRGGQFVRMDENMTLFVDNNAACERLLRTPIPVSYTRHTSRFLVLWLLVLPFVLWPTCGWATVPAAVLLGFVLLAIEEIGVQIEEPFVILPLEALANTMATNVRDIVAESDTMTEVVEKSIPNPLVPWSENGVVKDMYEEAAMAA